MPRGRVQYGFFPASGTDYSYGQEPELARRLGRLGKALKLHLIGISGYRTPQHSLEVGGFANDPHTVGQASDTPGIESVPEFTLRRFGLTRPFPGTAELDHIQLLGGARGTPRISRGPHTFTLADYWIQGGGRRGLSPIMAAIGMAESGGVIDKVGGPNDDGSYDYGWLQINSSHGYDRAKLLSDPVYTARAGAAIERSQGLTAWTTYNTGAYRAFLGSGKTTVPTQGRVRPGGETPPGGDSGTADPFASYKAEGDAINAVYVVPGTPLVLPFNPADVFKDVVKNVNSTKDFLQWIGWLFHPRNVLRVVEFMTGFTLILVGVHVSLETYRDGGDVVGNAVGRGAKKATGAAVQATPVGRSVRVAKGVRSGRASVKTAERRKEFEGARKAGKKQEARRQEGKTRKQRIKSEERDQDRKYGGVPF